MKKAEMKKLDAMLDRWEAETKAGKDNPGKVSDPKPGWDHLKYLSAIYDKGWNK
jgi:hypothetical protein